MGPKKLSKRLLTGHTLFLSVTHPCQCTLHIIKQNKISTFQKSIVSAASRELYQSGNKCWEQADLRFCSPQPDTSLRWDHGYGVSVLVVWCACSHPSFRQYRIILVGDRGTWVWMTCLVVMKLHQAELATSWLQVRRPTTMPLCHLANSPQNNFIQQ